MAVTCEGVDKDGRKQESTPKSDGMQVMIRRFLPIEYSVGQIVSFVDVPLKGSGQNEIVDLRYR